MHEVRACGAALLLAFFAVPAPGFDLPEIKSRGSIKVIAAEGVQPEEFSFTAGSDPGFEREMLEGFARLQHVKLEVVRGKQWDDRIPALLRGEGDVIVGLTETESRRRVIAFTAETIPTRHVVVTHVPHAPVNTVEQLRRERVGVVISTSWAQAAVDAGVPDARIETFAELEPLIEAMKAGRIGATVLSVSDFTLAAKRHPGLEAGVFLGPLAHQAWGIRKEDQQLAEALNGYIENLRKTSSWSRLVVKYFGAQALTVLGRAQGH
jgi:polar amino acid transport system substrate-binding protein